MTEGAPADKLRPTVREYAGDGIVVRWEPRFCIHSGLCVRALPGVFDRTKRPWITPLEASADDVARVVAGCPSGALHFERTDGGPHEEPAEVFTVDPQPNGPLYVRGRIRLTTEQGDVLREDVRMALCRCGASRHKPFCDGTHEDIGFRTGEA